MTEAADTPKYDVSISFDPKGPDGNAFVILGKVKRALQSAGASATDCTAFYNEATAGDYEHLLATVRKWVRVA